MLGGSNLKTSTTCPSAGLSRAALTEKNKPNASKHEAAFTHTHYSANTQSSSRDKAMAVYKALD